MMSMVTVIVMVIVLMVMVMMVLTRHIWLKEFDHVLSTYIEGENLNFRRKMDDMCKMIRQRIC